MSLKNYFPNTNLRSPANLNNLLEGEELGPSCGDKWDAKRDKDGFKLPEEPNKVASARILYFCELIWTHKLNHINDSYLTQRFLLQLSCQNDGF